MSVVDRLRRFRTAGVPALRELPAVKAVRERLKARGVLGSRILRGSILGQVGEGKLLETVRERLEELRGKLPALGEGLIGGMVRGKPAARYSRPQVKSTEELVRAPAKRKVEAKPAKKGYIY